MSSLSDYASLRAFACVKKDNLYHNLAKIRTLHPEKKTIVMLKANGYGHGAGEIAKLLDGHCDYFGVASIEEGVELRQSGIYQTKIIIFSGFFNCSSIETIFEHQLIPMIHSPYQIDYLSAYFKQPFAEIWLKANSGMNRLGLNEAEFNRCYQHLSQKTDKPISALTHLAESESVDQHFTRKQMDYFQRLVQNKALKHISIFNSAAALSQPDYPNDDTIRIGLALYGINTAPSAKCQISLKPAMQLHSHIIAVQKIAAGDSVGYNRRYIADKPRKIAIISIGYGDGYPQMMPNGTPVVIDNKQYPSVGKVSMDLMAVDITEAPETVGISTPVTLFGEALPLEVLTQGRNLSPYAMLTAISPRVKRVYI